MPRTVQQPDSVDRSRQIREWIVALAENFGADLSVARIDLLEAGLADLNLEQIHTAFKLCALRRERFFPSLAELRGYVDGGAKQTADVIDDELAWQGVLEHCRVHVWKDGGRTGPRLSDAVEFAVRRAGGWFYVAECPERDLVFAKQRFLDGLANVRGGVEQFAFLPDGPVKRMIAAAAVSKALPGTRQAVASQTSEARDDRITPDYFDEARQQLGDVLRPSEAQKQERKRFAVIPHVAPPETFAGTPEGKLFREWGRKYHAGETALWWRDYRAANSPEAVAVGR